MIVIASVFEFVETTKVSDIANTGSDLKKQTKAKNNFWLTFWFNWNVKARNWILSFICDAELCPDGVEGSTIQIYFQFNRISSADKFIAF